jgi:hypothetical protein
MYLIRTEMQDAVAERGLKKDSEWREKKAITIRKTSMTLRNRDID